MSITKEEYEAYKKRGTQLFVLIKKYLEDKGFEQLRDIDDRYMSNGDIQVFNCPHKCGTIGVYKGFPEIGVYQFRSAEERDEYVEKHQKTKLPEHSISKIPLDYKVEELFNVFKSSINKLTDEQ